MARIARNSSATTLRLLASAGLLCCAPGCSLFGGREPARLTSNDPGSKIPAIRKAADARDTQTARQLVTALASDDPAIRFYSIRGLQSMTGETFGYAWYGEDGNREAAIKRWNSWLDAQPAHSGELAELQNGGK